MGCGQGRKEVMHQTLGTASCSHHSPAGLPPPTEGGVWGWLGEQHGGHTHLPSWGRRVMVQSGSTHLHSKSSPGSMAGTWDWEWQGKTCPVINASSAEGIPETSTAGPIARACKESQCQSTGKRPSSLGNRIWPQHSAWWLLGTSVSHWELLSALTSILHSLSFMSQSPSRG